MAEQPIRNNLMLGVKGWMVETGSADRRTTLDYNGYSRPAGEQLIKWSRDEGQSWGRYPTLEEFSKNAGHEVHGIVIEFKDFMGADPPTAGDTYNPINPRPSSAEKQGRGRRRADSEHQ